MYFSYRVRVILTGILFLAALFGVWWLFFVREAPPAPPADTEDEMDAETTDGFVTYRNDTFGFEIRHPADWEVREFPDEPIAPMFNIVPPGQNITFPLTHHSDATHVSVYPKGVPTEGVFGESHESALDFSVTPRRATDFVLENGSVWATYLNPVQNLAEWNTAGFVWGSVRVENSEIACFSDGEEVSEARCDPLFGDTIVRRGSVSADKWSTVERIVRSFRFTEEVATTDVVLDVPQANSVVSSPLRVEGEARGSWYFEAAFPVRLLDANGKEIVTAPAEAMGEWMTDEFVRFSAVLVFEAPETDAGFLVLEKDNPSGLPENAGEVHIPVRFR